MPESSSKNIFIFTGEDDFSLRQKIEVWKNEFARKFSATSIVTLDAENLSEIDLVKKFEEILTPSLFSSKKLVIAKNCLPAKASQTHLIAGLDRLLASLPADYFLVFWQKSLDRRLGFNKNLAAKFKLTEFNVPHNRELNNWIKTHAARLKINMDDGAVEALAVLSGRDLFEEKKIGGRVIERIEMFDLWQINSDMQKLAGSGQTVTKQLVSELVTAQVPENVFALSDAVVAQNKKQALEVLENLMGTGNMDEKSMAIKLLGLLSEQIRSLLVVNLLQKENMDQNQIAEFLGWSPGRVFMTLKKSTSLNIDKLKRLLKQLLAADAVIKVSETSPKLLIDLLIAK